MTEENLEDKVKSQSLWDFFVSAYSASKATKLALITAIAGMPITTVALTSAAAYLGFKTTGAALKYIGNVVMNPTKYLTSKKIVDETYTTIMDYHPFGRYRRPHFLGSTLSIATHATGF